MATRPPITDRIRSLREEAKTTEAIRAILKREGYPSTDIDRALAPVQPGARFDPRTATPPETTGDPFARVQPTVEQAAETQAAVEETQTAEEERSAYVSSLIERTAGVNVDDPEDLKAYVTRIASESGVDVTNPDIALILNDLPDMSPEMAEMMVRGWASNPSYRSAPLTAYDEVLAASGFANYAGPTALPGVLRAEAQTGATIEGSAWDVHPTTGWIRYRNGVIVNPDPNNPSVSFEPGSSAPGSPEYMRTAAQWSDERTQEWRQTLVDKGYLEKGDKSEAGFLAALQNYHMARYANWGIAPSYEGAPGTGGPLEGQLTARDFQEQIKSDVTEQFRRVYGADPTRGELEQWARFITQKSIELQRKMVRRGVDPGTAATTSGAEAEELFVRRLENEPGAQLLQEAIPENTALRDSLQAAVSITRSLS